MRFISTLSSIILIFVSGCFPAMSDEKVVPGCEYKPVNEKYMYKPFKEPETIRSSDGRLITELRVAFAEHVIAGCPTKLRNYNGALVGPTLRMKPGDTLNLKLINNLPEDGQPQGDDINEPHNFNVTNFHSHGLHVSPSGNSDNVLINILPSKEFDVEISIPQDHPTGTFWYHAHVHGSTALQVSSGMAGALIIEDKDSNTSLDAIPEIEVAEEKIFVMQQISYDQEGVIENYSCFGPRNSNKEGCNWTLSNRHTSINGQIVPTIQIKEGEVQRWRFIHAGVRESIDLGLSGNDDKPWDLYEIALDGLSLGYINRWQHIEMQPGYRVDVLVKAPPLPEGDDSYTYWLYDRPSVSGLRETEEARQVLARIEVLPGDKQMALPCETFNQRGKCSKLAKTRPHKDITDAELSPEQQKVRFNIAQMTCPEDITQPCKPCSDNSVEGCKLRFMVNNRPFNPDIVRELELNTASEWELSSAIASHPFHIHVNPFQFTRKNPDGEDEIVWKDTLFVLNDEKDGQGHVSKSNAINIRSRYERYIGKFVLHCHILDHEDQGMMQLVEIVLPGNNAHQH